MKRNLTIVLATLMAILLLQTRSFKLQSHVEFPPNGGLANDPGQTNCAHCHSTLGPPIARNSQFVIHISPDSAGLATSSVVTSSTTYTPNHPNWISFELTGANTNTPGDTPYYGFQFTALRTANDSMAGSFTLVDTNTSMQTSATSDFPPQYGPVSYVGHYNPNHIHYIQTWTFVWNAPDSSAGPVTFYYAGNLGNGNLPLDVSLSNTDSIFIGTVTLNPGAYNNVGITNVPGNIGSVAVYPVPFSQDLNADLYLNTSSAVTLTLMSIDGQTIKELYNGNAAQGHFSRSLQIGDVAAGMYFVRVQSGTDSQVVKVLKY